MYVYFFVGKNKAYIFVEAIMREFKNSIRFLLRDNTTMTIKKSDIIKIEDVD